MNKVKLFTIGFTKKSAEVFFTKLSKAGVKHVIDIRLNRGNLPFCETGGPGAY